jgi:prepilin-type N-terminal cleavage/methylation domain-containing protein
MKKLNKKGFTIVELVIVIAVIGILAGVLIPTFTIVVRKANESAAMQALETARKEYMTQVDATADDFADFDKNYAYYYGVSKKGQTISELQGYYVYDNGTFKKLENGTGYAQDYVKATEYVSGTDYYYWDAEAETPAWTKDTSVSESNFDTKKATNGGLYVLASVQGIKIYKKAPAVNP